MESIPTEFWWLVPVGIFVGAILAGYRKGKKPRTAIQGAAIINSEIGRDLIEEVSRLADAAEAIAAILKHDSDEAARLRKDHELDELRKEIERLKRGKP